MSSLKYLFLKCFFSLIFVNIFLQFLHPFLVSLLFFLSSNLFILCCIRDCYRSAHMTISFFKPLEAYGVLKRYLNAIIFVISFNILNIFKLFIDHVFYIFTFLVMFKFNLNDKWSMHSSFYFHFIVFIIII